MTTLEPAALAATITPDELRARLADPTLTVIDVRPIAAYNGWRLHDERRGGHVPGARAFPAAWLASVDEPEIARLLAEKGEDAIPNPEILLFHGALEEDPLDPTGPDPGAAATSGANRSTPA